jgi:hypothetical protein
MPKQYSSSYNHRNNISSRISIFGGGEPEGKTPLARPGLRWEDNIEKGLKEIGWSVDWIDMVRDRGRRRAGVNTVMKIRVP